MYETLVWEAPEGGYVAGFKDEVEEESGAGCYRAYEATEGSLSLF